MPASPLAPAEYTLHRYYLWANRMFGHVMSLPDMPKDAGIEKRLWFQASFAYMAMWLSLLYVVVEGWEELKLQDDKVSELLTSPNRDVLRRLRNGAFHFQPDYFDKRFTDFLDLKGETAQWARALHGAIGEWFVSRARTAGINIEITDDA
jgi:hypothetical protein